MHRDRLNKPSPAFVLAAIALFVALGGTATALTGTNTVFSDDIAPGNVHASDIGANQVKSSDIAPGVVQSSDIADGGVKALDIDLGTLRATAFDTDNPPDATISSLAAGTDTVSATIDSSDFPGFEDVFATADLNITGGTAGLLTCKMFHGVGVSSFVQIGNTVAVDVPAGADMQVVVQGASEGTPGQQPIKVNCVSTSGSQTYKSGDLNVIALPGPGPE
jgi:hypothetical protein